MTRFRLASASASVIALACLAGVLATARAQSSAPKPDPRTVVLTGNRFKPLGYGEMSPAQRTMIDHLFAGERGGANGPFNVLLRAPEAGDLAQQFGGATRFRTGLAPDVSETIIIMTGRFWMAQYEWNAHKAAALRAHVDPQIIDAIATGRRPASMPAPVETAYNFVDELLTTHQVSDAVFEATRARFGEKGVVDILGLSGWYSLVSMALDTDRYPLPAGAQPELKPLENPLPMAGKGFSTPIPGSPNPAFTRSTVNGKTLNLRGDRFRPLTYEQMTPEQKAMTDEALAARGPGGSFNITLRSPEAGRILYALGDIVRAKMMVPGKLNEMAIMLMGRFWGTQMVWLAHSKAAVDAGLGADAAKAIGEGRHPEGLKPDEQAVYNFFAELFKTREVSDAGFNALKSAVGERGMVELIVSAGYYEFTCMFVNTDRIPPGPEQKPVLEYLARPFP